MSTRRWVWMVASVTVALLLAGCGAAPIPDDEIAGMVGSSTAGTAGDMAALSIFGGGTPMPSRGVTVSHTITVPGIGSLTYDYTIDYLKNGETVADPVFDPTWDEVTFVGSAELIVNLPNYEADRMLDVDFDATGFHDTPDDNRVIVNGTSTASGTASWTNPANDVTAGYSFDLTKTWTDVNIDDPACPGWSGYPSSGTIVITGSVERHRESPSGIRTGSWSGTITITFDGDSIVPIVVNGVSYQLNLVTGEVTAGT